MIGDLDSDAGCGDGREDSAGLFRAGQVGADCIVDTRIRRPAGNSTRIDYVMHLASDSGERVWKASDVLLGGTISRVSVQRSDFRAFLDTTGAARLIARLQQQIADLSGGTM